MTSGTTIIVRLSLDLYDDRELARELATEAADIAIDFSAMFPDRESGGRHGVGYQRIGYVWSVWWTKSRAVVVRCERRAA